MAGEAVTQSLIRITYPEKPQIPLRWDQLKPGARIQIPTGPNTFADRRVLCLAYPPGMEIPKNGNKPKHSFVVLLQNGETEKFDNIFAPHDKHAGSHRRVNELIVVPPSELGQPELLKLPGQPTVTQTTDRFVKAAEGSLAEQIVGKLVWDLSNHAQTLDIMPKVKLTDYPAVI
jgi:hypothetical protein